MRFFVRLVLAIGFVFCGGVASVGDEIINLGVEAGRTTGMPQISPDGKTVVGRDGPMSGPYSAYFWTKESGINYIEVFDPSHTGNYAWGVSNDGTIIGASGWPFAAMYIRTPDGVQTNFGSLTGKPTAHISAVARHGHYLGSYKNGISERHSFIWKDGVLTDIGGLEGGIDFTAASSFSSDGSTVAGSSYDENGRQAIRWTAEDGTIGLGSLFAGLESDANDISADGTTIVGGSEYDASTISTLPFRWTEEEGMVRLANAGDFVTGSANDVSGDGSVIVGSMVVDNGDAVDPEAFIWTESLGLVNFEDFLVDRGLDIAGWDFAAATAISDDASKIVGRGTYNGEIATFYVEIDSIPEPSNVLLLAVFLCGISMVGFGKFRQRGLHSSR